MLVKYSLLLLLMPCVLAFNALAQDKEKGIMNTFHSISSNDMLKDAAELTSAKYGGRLLGSPGYLHAAQWVAAELKKAGYKVIHLYTSGTVKTVYYHHPLDTTDALHPKSWKTRPSCSILGCWILPMTRGFIS